MGRRWKESEVGSEATELTISEQDETHSPSVTPPLEQRPVVDPNKTTSDKSNKMGTLTKEAANSFRRS